MGVGIQVQIQIGSFVGGVELIWNLSNKVYFFRYNGATVGADKSQDVIDFVKNLKSTGLSGFCNSVKEFCSPISRAVSISLFLVFGKHTKLPSDYTGVFNVTSVSFSKYTFSYAYCKNNKKYIASAGYGFQSFGTFNINVSGTYYYYEAELNLKALMKEVKKKVNYLKKYFCLF
jgi:hypothetical protein